MDLDALTLKSFKGNTTSLFESLTFFLNSPSYSHQHFFDLKSIIRRSNNLLQGGDFDALFKANPNTKSLFLAFLKENADLFELSYRSSSYKSSQSKVLNFELQLVRNITNSVAFEPQGSSLLLNLETAEQDNYFELSRKDCAALLLKLKEIKAIL